MHELLEPRIETFTPTTPITESQATWTFISLFLVFVDIPLAVAFLVPPTGWIPCLWIVAGCVACSASLRRRHVRTRVVKSELKRVLLRFAASTVLLSCAVALVAPEEFLAWPRERPLFWLAVIVLYPALSVLPQEMIYRRWLFQRLRPLVRSNRCAVWVSALAFAAMHAIYRNAPAVALTLIGGWFFADTYRRTGSLRLVCLEHALYGVLVFTIGLGDHFSGFGFQ
jgi:membrane protease YdiL (CAAX protease family)